MSKTTNTFDLSGGPADAGVQARADENALVFNLTDVEEDKKFELIPKGTYAAIVDSFDFGESSNGNPMITVIYSLIDPEFENRKIYDFMVLGGDGKDFGLAKLKKFLVRICPEIDFVSFNPAQFAESGTALGRECRVTLSIQTQKKGDYKGEKRNQVKDILAPDNAGSFLSR